MPTHLLENQNIGKVSQTGYFNIRSASDLPQPDINNEISLVGGQAYAFASGVDIGDATIIPNGAILFSMGGFGGSILSSSVTRPTIKAEETDLFIYGLLVTNDQGKAVEASGGTGPITNNVILSGVTLSCLQPCTFANISGLFVNQLFVKGCLNGAFEISGTGLQVYFNEIDFSDIFPFPPNGATFIKINPGAIYNTVVFRGVNLEVSLGAVGIDIDNSVPLIGNIIFEGRIVGLGTSIQGFNKAQPNVTISSISLGVLPSKTIGGLYFSDINVPATTVINAQNQYENIIPPISGYSLSPSSEDFVEGTISGSFRYTGLQEKQLTFYSRITVEASSGTRDIKHGVFYKPDGGVFTLIPESEVPMEATNKYTQLTTSVTITVSTNDEVVARIANTENTLNLLITAHQFTV